MNIKEIIQPLLQIALPLIQQFIKSTVIPKIIRKSYERFDTYANDIIESLSDLVEKIKAEENEEKKLAHINGFKLGIKTIRAISNKMLQASECLDDEVYSLTSETPF